MSAKAARRYANAMLQSAIEKDILEEVHMDMELIHNTVTGSRDLVLFLKSPVIKNDIKRKALMGIFEDRVKPETSILLNLLLDKNREQLLEAICKSYLDLYNVHKGIIDVGVFSAFDLADDQKKDLLKMLEQSTGKKVILDFTTDKSLRGGLAVRIDDTVIDGTIKHKISQLKNQFAANAAN